MNVLDYPVRVERLSEDDGGGFAAYALDLPGCMSDGDTQEAAIENLRDAISEWIDQATAMGRDVPLPTEQRRWA